MDLSIQGCQFRFSGFELLTWSYRVGRKIDEKDDKSVASNKRCCPEKNCENTNKNVASNTSVVRKTDEKDEKSVASNKSVAWKN